MAEKQPSSIDRWLERGTPRKRKALESASRYFDANDTLTVNTLEAVYGQESSFGTLLGKRGSADAAGHFQFEPETARRYGLSVSKENDQRFDMDRASSAMKMNGVRKGKYLCTVGHWRTIDERPVFICA